ncbi:MAG: thymidylate synthase [Candidatus Magasanikbacteria bacterium]
MIQYLQLLKKIKESGIDKQNRTGVDTRFLPGQSLKFNLKKNFPLITTKKVSFYSVVSELFWFWTASRNEKYLRKKLGTSIWKGDAYSKRWLLQADFPGDVGRIYGVQWRKFLSSEGESIDQVARVLNGLEYAPLSRRHIIEGWNPGELHKMALPPCHNTYQYIRDGKGGLHLVMGQRSADMFLGVPFNIASASLQLAIFAQIHNLEAKTLTIDLGDAHIYHNHFKAVEKQLSRQPRDKPKLKLSPEITKEFLINLKDNQSLTEDKLKELVTLKDYNPHPPIRAPLNTGEEPTVEMIVAKDQNGLIGFNGSRPWPYIRKDMKRFVQITKGKPIIVGRKTFENDIPEPLKDRKNIILTNQEDYKPANPNGEKVVVVNSPLEAFDEAVKNSETFTVIGGAQIYREFLKITDVIYETIIEDRFKEQKDSRRKVHFPDINKGKWMKNVNWTEMESKTHDKTEEGFDLTFRTLKSERHP